MTTPETTRRPGRPATGKAMSPAQRMRLTRERARVAVLDEDLDDLTGMSDTGLFEVLRVAHQRRMPFEIAKIARELLRRATEGTSYTATVTVIDSATVAAMDSATVTKTDSATVTGKDGLSGRDRRILEMHRAGESNREIARKIGVTEGTVRYWLKKLGAH